MSLSIAVVSVVAKPQITDVTVDCRVSVVRALRSLMSLSVQWFQW